MSIVKRTELNRPLTHAEVDSNFEYVDVAEWAPRTYLKGQKVYTLGNNGIYPIYICLVNHDETSYITGNFNEYGLINGNNTKLWLKTGADTFTGVITGVTVNATYQAYTGSTISGTTLNLIGHNIPDSHLNFVNAIRNTYKAYTGITTSGNNIIFDGHNTSPLSVAINLEPFINNNYKSISGVTLSGNALFNYVGHNITPIQIDLEPVIKNNYKAITGITQITNNLLQFVGHNLPTVIFDIGTIIGLNYKAYTGATYNSTTNALTLVGHNVSPATIDFATGIRNAYKAYTGSTFVGNILTLIGHGVPNAPYDLSTILNGVSYIALTGVTLNTRGLRFPSHGQPIQTIDLSNPVGEIYKAITGVTLAGTNLLFQGHNTSPLSVAINLAGIITGGTTGTGKTESVYTTVINLSGGIIPKGSLVNIYDAQGGVPMIRMSQAAQAPLVVVDGLVTNDILNGSTGQIINYGLLSGLTLNPSYNVGDVLYLSDTTPGDTTNIPSGLLKTSRTVKVGRVMTNGTPGTLFVDIVSEDVEMPITANERKLVEGNLMSTGVYQYQSMVSGVSSPAFDILPLKGWITLNVDSYSDNPNVIYVDFPGAGSVVSPFIGTDDSTYVFITSGSSVSLQPTFPLPQERRNMIYLGRVDHSDRATVQYIDNAPDFVVSPFNSLRDILSSVKLINIGVRPVVQVSNLNIGYTNGSLYGNGINWKLNRLNPNRVAISGVTSTQLKYSTSTQANFPSTVDIDPTNYDPSGLGALVGVVSGATNQRIYMSPSGVVWVQYGQVVYSDLISAVLNIQREEYIEHSVNKDVNILIGAISVLSSATDLTDRHQAIVHTATKTGDLISNLISIGFATSLQQAYNNSTDPEIITDPVLGAVSIRQGSGSDSDPVLEIRNGINNITTTITGAGEATVTNLITNNLSVLNPIPDDNQTQVLGIDISGLTYRTTLDNLIRNNYLAYTGSSMSGNILFLQGHNIPGVSFDITNSITDTYKAFTGATITNSILSFISHNVAPLSLDLTNTVKENYKAFTGATLIGSVIHFSGHNGNQTLDLSSLSITTLTGITLQTVMDNGSTTDHQMLFLGSTGQTRTQIDKGSFVLFSDDGDTTLDFYVSSLGDDARITYQNSNGFYTRLYALSPSANRTLFYPNKNGTLAIEGDYKAFTGATLVGYFLHFSGHNVNQTIDLTSLSGGITGLTPGSVLFASSGGTLGQNNANFYWDNVLSRLSITNSDNPLNLNNPSSGLGVYFSLGNFDPNYMGIHSMSSDEGLVEFSPTEAQFYYAGRKLRYNIGTDVLYYSGTTITSEGAIETNNSHVFAAYDTDSATWTNSTLLGYDGLNVRTPGYTSKFQGGLISTLDNVSGGTLNLIFDPLTGTKIQRYQNRTGTIALLGDYNAFTGATLVGTVIHFSGHNGNQTLDLASIAAGTYFAYTGSSLSGNVFSLTGHNVSPVSYDFTNAINNTYQAYTGAAYNSTTNALTLVGHNVLPNVVDFATGIRNAYKAYTGATLFGAILTLNGHGIVNASLNFTNAIKANYKAFTGATLVGNVIKFSGHSVNQSLDLSAIAGGGSGSYVALTGVTITNNILSFASHGLGTTDIDITNAINATYRGFTGATISGNTIYFSGHNGNQTLDLSSIAANRLSIYMLTDINADVSPYKDMVNLSAYTPGALATGVTSVSTTPTIIGEFITTLGYPNITVIPVGEVLLHFETQAAGLISNAYYTYFELYKRDVSGAETFILTSDNSTPTTSTSVIQTTIGGFITSNLYVSSTDRLVIRIYAVKTFGVDNITLRYDDSTNARFELGTLGSDATNFIPYSGATNNINLNNKTISGAILTTGVTVTGLTLSLGSDSAYDTYYRDSSGLLKRLGNGLNGQVYTSTLGAPPSWQTPVVGLTTYKAFTGATLIGSVIHFSGHNVNQTLDLSSLTTGTTLQTAYNASIQPQITTSSLLGALSLRRGSLSDADNVLQIQNGIGNITARINGFGQAVFSNLTGVTLNLLNVPTDDNQVQFLSIDVNGATYRTSPINVINSTYKAFTGVTLTNNILTFAGHNVPVTFIDITNAITNTYVAYTGGSLSGNILTLNGHNVPVGLYDFTNSITNTYSAFTGATYNSTTNVLNLLGHNLVTANLSLATGIRNLYVSTTGGTITNNILTFVGHNLANYTIDITNAITNTYKSYSGSSLSGAILTLNGHNVSNDTYDFTNAIKANYSAFTGVTLSGDNIRFSGHSVNQTLDLTPSYGAFDVANTWDKAQRGAFKTLTYAATTTPDLSTGNNFRLVLTGNTTLGVPTNIVPGQSGVINVRQDITGSRTMAYAWCYEFIGGTAPVLSTGKLVFDQLVYNVNKYSTSTVTISNASPAVVTWNNHGLVSGDKLKFTTTGSLPTGVNTTDVYWVTKVNDNQFKLSSSLANAQAATFINTSSAGSGTHTATNISITLSLNAGMA